MADQEIRYLGDVQRLALGPDDVLVVTIPRVISDEIAIRIRDQVKAALGGDSKVLVLSEGMTVGVLAKGAVDAPEPPQNWGGKLNGGSGAAGAIDTGAV